MTATIVMLSTGDNVICDLQEMFHEVENGEGQVDKKGLCLQMTHPYKLDILPGQEDNGNEGVSVRFTRWMAFSSEYVFKLPYTSVVTVGQPDSNILKAYERKVDAAKEKIEEQNKPKERVYASDVSVAGVGMSSGRGFR